jgi:peptidyl-prolyl cis-trans isomerase D
MARPTLALLAALILTACGTAKPGGMSGPSMKSRLSEPAPGTRSEVVSWDILDREPLANTAEVKHILIGWKDLAEAYGGRINPRAAARTKADAEVEVKALLAQLAGGADFDTVMREHSEDEGSAATNRPYTVTPDAQLVIEFRQLGLRLKTGELGVIQSDYGFHIIKRLK